MSMKPQISKIVAIILCAALILPIESQRHWWYYGRNQMRSPDRSRGDRFRGNRGSGESRENPSRTQCLLINTCSAQYQSLCDQCPTRQMPPPLAASDPMRQKNCLRARGSTECFVYDPQRAAVSLDEALENFRDPVQALAVGLGSTKPLVSIGQQFGEDNNKNKAFKTITVDQLFEGAPQAAPISTPATTGWNNWPGREMSTRTPLLGSGNIPTPIEDHLDPVSTCANNDECLGCANAVLNRLIASNIKEGKMNELTSILQSTRLRSKIKPDLSQRTRPSSNSCPQLRRQKPLDDDLPRLATAQDATSRVAFNLTAIPQGSVCLTPKQNSVPSRTRTKRQTEEEKMTGMRATLNCSYKKGDPVSDNSTYRGLCSTCWTYRFLPTEYEPRIINEISCNSDDTTCIAGYAECRPRYGHMKVLRNVGTETNKDYVEESLPITLFCECQVPDTSALMQLIRK